MVSGTRMAGVWGVWVCPIGCGSVNSLHAAGVGVCSMWVW